MAEAQKVVQSLLKFEAEAETLGAARGHQEEPAKHLGAVRIEWGGSGQHLSLPAGLPDKNIAEGDDAGAILQFQQEKSVIYRSDS